MGLAQALATDIQDAQNPCFDRDVDTFEKYFCAIFAVPVGWFRGSGFGLAPQPPVCGRKAGRRRRPDARRTRRSCLSAADPSGPAGRSSPGCRTGVSRLALARLHLNHRVAAGSPYGGRGRHASASGTSMSSYSRAATIRPSASRLKTAKPACGGMAREPHESQLNSTAHRTPSSVSRQHSMPIPPASRNRSAKKDRSGPSRGSDATLRVTPGRIPLRRRCRAARRRLPPGVRRDAVRRHRLAGQRRIPAPAAYVAASVHRRLAAVGAEDDGRRVGRVGDHGHRPDLLVCAVQTRRHLDHGPALDGGGGHDLDAGMVVVQPALALLDEPLELVVPVEPLPRGGRGRPPRRATPLSGDRHLRRPALRGTTRPGRRGPRRGSTCVRARRRWRSRGTTARQHHAPSRRPREGRRAGGTGRAHRSSTRSAVGRAEQMRVSSAPGGSRGGVA